MDGLEESGSSGIVNEIRRGTNFLESAEKNIIAWGF